MNQGIVNVGVVRRRPPWRAGVALVLALSCGTLARADISGPVVGFQRVEVDPGPQWVEPSLRPFAPQTDEGETTGQVLSSYLGDDFRSGTSANDADLVGCGAQQDGTGEVSMMWRDQQEHWRDLAGNDAEPDANCVAGFWLELVFDGKDSAGTRSRELVLSGQVVW